MERVQAVTSEFSTRKTWGPTERRFCFFCNKESQTIRECRANKKRYRNQTARPGTDPPGEPPKQSRKRTGPHATRGAKMGPNEVVPASAELTGVNSVLNCISAMECLQAGCEVAMLSAVTARTRHRCLIVGVAPATAFRR